MGKDPERDDGAMKNGCLLVHQPSAAITDPDLAHQGQCGQARLGLADQKDGQEPSAQRQLGTVHHRAGRQRGLQAAIAALKQRSTFMLSQAVHRRLASRADEALRPAKPAQFICALRLRPVSIHEVGDRHSALKLNSVDRHVRRSLRQECQRLSSMAQAVSQRSLMPNQVRFKAEWRISAAQVRFRSKYSD